MESLKKRAPLAKEVFAHLMGVWHVDPSAKNENLMKMASEIVAAIHFDMVELNQSTHMDLTEEQRGMLELRGYRFEPTQSPPEQQ